MAQLVDGRAEEFSHEYMILFHSQIGQLQQHPDWPKLAKDEELFVWKTFALMVFQSASSFDRRIVAPLAAFPYALLSFARVRHDLPDERRRCLAKLLLDTPLQLLDINTLKIRNMFSADLEIAKKTGKLGVKLFATLKATRRLWKADVRENERLNKQLKLFTERAPNSSLDLISARLGLKFRLGTAGLRHEEMETSKPRNWTRVRPMAANVLDSCLDNWMDGLSDVLSQEHRFQEPGFPDWCPTRETVHSWMPVLQPAPLSGNSNTRIFSGLVNRKLYQFVQGKTAQVGNASEFPEPYFSAIAIIQANQIKPGRPYRLPNDGRVYLFCETVNRAVRLLLATWNGKRIIIDQPWRFVWGADLFSPEQCEEVLQCKHHLKIIAFPVGWVPAKLGDDAKIASGLSLEGTCMSKSGDLALVTISYWEEAAWLKGLRFNLVVGPVKPLVGQVSGIRRVWV